MCIHMCVYKIREPQLRILHGSAGLSRSKPRPGASAGVGAQCSSVTAAWMQLQIPCSVMVCLVAKHDYGIAGHHIAPDRKKIHIYIYIYTYIYIYIYTHNYATPLFSLYPGGVTSCWRGDKSVPTTSPAARAHHEALGRGCTVQNLGHLGLGSVVLALGIKLRLFPALHAFSQPGPEIV